MGEDDGGGGMGSEGGEVEIEKDTSRGPASDIGVTG